MSKTCAICGEKITLISEHNLSKDYPKVKICFTCYEYAATAMKGNKKAIGILRDRYRHDISSDVVKYINSFDVDIMPRRKGENKDEFMDLMNNDLKPERKQKEKPKTNIIRLDKLSDVKKDKLIRIKIISTILSFVFLVLGLLFSFYIFTQGLGAVSAIIMAVVSVGFALVFSFIKIFVDTIIKQ